MDLIADVLQQADVTKRKLATLKLTATSKLRSAENTEVDFQKATLRVDDKRARNIAAVEFKKDQARVPGYETTVTGAESSSHGDPKKQAMRALETVLATKMIEGMMPKDQDELYGEGTAGDVWRGFHIDAMGKALADKRLFATSGSENNENDRAQKFGRTKTIVPFAG
jgi:peptidoglycan hydrolase FlgJ